MVAVIHTYGTPIAFSTVLSTELNALGNGAFSAASSALDNSTNLHELVQIRLILASYTPTGGLVSVYMLAGDGTNYTEGGGAIVPPSSQLLYSWAPNAAAAAHPLLSPFLELANTHAKFVVRNGSGVSLAATGNTLDVRTASFSSI